MHDWKQILADEGLPGRSATVGREASALRKEEWEAIDNETIGVIRREVTARNVLARAGVLDTSLKGPGWTSIKAYERGGRKPAKTSMSAEPAAPDHTTLTEKTVLIPIHHAEGSLFWRNVEAARNGRENLVTSEIAQSAAEVALQEDTFFYLGDSDLSIDGMLNPTNKQTQAGGAWSTDADAAYNNLNAAVGKLETENIKGERFLFAHPTDVKSLRRRFGTGSDSMPIKAIVEAGLIKAENVIPTTVRAAGTAALVALSRAYLKAWMPVDVTTEQLASTGRDPLFQTWTASTVRWDKPKACVELQSIT